jgi:hypothetical protein
MKEAEARYQRTLDTRQKTFGLTHEQLLKSTYKLMARYVVVSEHEKVYSFDAPSTEELREGPGTRVAWNATNCQSIGRADEKADKRQPMFGYEKR